MGRGITNARDVEGVCRRFLKLMKEEIDLYRVMTDFPLSGADSSTC